MLLCSLLFFFSGLFCRVVFAQPVPPSLLVVSANANSIFRYDSSSGDFLQQFDNSSAQYPYGLALGLDGFLYTATTVGSGGTFNSHIDRYDPVSGKRLASFGALPIIRGMTIGPDGLIYVSAAGTNQVWRYNPSTGVFVDVFVSSVSSPTGLVFGPDGHLYVCAAGDSIQKFNGTTGAVISTILTEAGLKPNFILFGPDGKIYLGTSLYPNQVRRYTSTGSFDTLFATSGNLNLATAMTFGPDGHLYVGSDLTASVLRFNGTTGALIDTFIPSGSGGLATNITGLLFLPQTVAPSTGTILVSTNLPAATFTITGPNTYPGVGTSFTVPNAPVGTYTIQYGDMAGYTKPPNDTKTLPAGGSIFFGGTYTALAPPTGTISITATRQGQPFTGASFVLNTNGSFYTSGTTPFSRSGVPIGDYMISWAPRAGYTTPSSETKSVTPGGNTPFTTNYVVDTSADSDQDGIPDAWELDGRWVDGQFLNLPGMGANYLKKDIFVELDWFATTTHSHMPDLQSTYMQAVVAAFAKHDITLHLDTGSLGGGNRLLLDGVAIDDDLSLRTTELGAFSRFNNLKQQNFASIRDGIFHYVIFGHNQPGTDSSGIANQPGCNVIITLGSWGASDCRANGTCTGTPLQQAGTFMHELGHNLGLGHGGDQTVGTTKEDVNFKPNYLSVMNYLFQTIGLYNRGKGWGVLDYSNVKLPDLDENHLNEFVGLNGGSAIAGLFGTRYFNPTTNRLDDVLSTFINGPINWNGDTDLGQTSVAANINYNNTTMPVYDDGYIVLRGYNDWDNIQLRNPCIGQLAGGNSAPVPNSEYTFSSETRIPPPKPALVIVKPSTSNRGIRIEWEASGVDTVVSYVIYKKSADGSYKVLNNSVRSGYLDDPAPQTSPSTQFGYKVSTLNIYGNESLLSEARCTGDINSDGIVDVQDLNAIRPLIGATCGDGRYQSPADVNSDCKIDVLDVSLISRMQQCTIK